MTQPNQSTLARKWVLDINTGATVAVPTWTTVKGLAELTPGDPEGTLQDDNVYEDAGYTGQTKTALGWTIEGTVLRRTSPTDVTSYDPGQEKLRALAATLGPTGVAYVRWYDRDGGPEAYTGFGEVTWSPEGGEMDALESVGFTVVGKGARTTITNPNAPALPLPAVLAITPATGPAAGGTLVKITATGIWRNGASVLSGAAAVKFGATNATSYFVADQNTIYAVSPAVAASTVQVTVTNATGASPNTSADDFVYV